MMMTKRSRFGRFSGLLVGTLLMGLTLVAGVATSASASPAVGMMWSGGSYETQLQEVEAIDRSGAGIMRYQLNWGFIAARKTTHPGTEWEPYDQVFQRAWERGITIYPYLYGRLDGSGRLPHPEEWEPQGSGWETWIYEVIQRYGHGGTFWSGKANPLPVPAWEIWNEPNAGWNNKNGSSVEPGYYAKFLKRSTSAVAEAQAPYGTAVLFGGLLELGNSATTMRPEDFIEEAHEAVSGLGAYYTALAHHPYVFKDAEGQAPTNEGDVKEVRDKVRESIEAVRGAMNAKGSGAKPIWVNELGWPVEHGTEDIPAVSESVQAQLLGFCFNMMDNQSATLNIDAMFWYNYRDIGVNEWHYATGLRRDGTKAYTTPNFRPAWDAFQEQTGASAWPVPATVQTYGADQISYRQARINGQTDPNGLPTNYKFEWGTTTGYGNSTATENAWEDNVSVTKSKTLTGLTPNTTYHYRMTATNENAEQSIGQDREFTTPPAKPIVTTEGHGSAYVEEETGKVDVEGKVNPNGFATTYRFEWGTQAEFEAGEYNNSTPEAEMEYTGYTEAKPVEATIEGLKGETTYHYRLVAENSEGSSTGSDQSLTTPNWKPGVSTGEEGDAGTNEATIYGSVNPRGFASTYQFEWGTWEEYLEGPLTNVIPAEPKSVGSGTTGVAVEETLKGLAPGSIYIFRLIATNSEGTTEGDYGYVVTETGLVAVYSFEEGEGTTLNDLVGEHDGTVEGGAAWVEGKYGTALDFDGTDDFVDIPHAADLSFDEDFTLQAWVRPDTLNVNKGFVLAKGQGLPLSGYWLKASHGAEVPAGITGDGGELSTVSGSSSLPTSEWSHLALVSEESESEGRIHRLYVDGELAATETEAAYGSPGTGSLKIGKGVGNYFDGAIDEVRIFASALTQAQIEEGKDHRLFQAEAEPATMEGLDAGTHLISFPSSLQISCSETALDDIELNEPSETIVATPVYAGCSLVVFGGGSLTFDGDGCKYVFDGGFDGLWQVESMDIVGCDGAGMTFTTTGGCIYTIPPQADLEAGYETIGSGAEREVEADVSSLIEVKRSGAGMCSSPTTYSASYSGTWNVAAFNQDEEQVGAWIE